ncbi:carbohydrate ABC transporter permease [Labrys wisconsinensis]|uniref:Multiple sugar transport system permease protein n=1 Tax=Labrys wisconsinensis TaxID=425677 RepID=A0ABU0J399_9HYPH|nr:sugar ABC transporter permease [Labrys wisconsinensis]MDQ0467687.1 multiple sugar transport system permease protein [Labrys wisconsinensis]
MATGGRRARHRPMPLLWFVPVLALLGLVTIYPAAFVVWMSFQKTNYFQLQGFVGLSNYVDVLGSDSFWSVATISLVYLAGSLVLSLAVGVAVALLFNAIGTTGGVLRVLTLFPWTLSMAVVGSIWLWMLNPSFGPVAYFLGEAGLSPGLMLGDPDLALALTILVTAWWSFPYVMVMVTATIQSIPAELYEAIAIDGGNAWHRFRYVTLPHLVPTLGSTGLNLAIIYLTLVTLLIVLTGGGPLDATTTLSLEIFRGTVQSVDIGPSAVLSVVVLAINIVLGAIYTRLTGRVTG